jgi:glycosyltransferase involved in cell wall biosynthesis
MSMPEGRKISICLLAYNNVGIIESTLRSILDQTITGYEVIVSDDCSSDGTWDRIAGLARQDARLRPIRTPRNMGMPGNANFAVAHSIRPYVALLHQDDLVRRDLLERWADVLDRYPDAAFVFNPYGVFESDFICEEPMPGDRIDGRWLLERYLFARWGCVVRGTTMIRRLAMRWPVGYVPEPVITVRQAWPDYYPDIYTGKSWSWQRLKYLYEIHGANRREFYGTDSLAGRWRQLRYRLRLSIETCKWLAYAVVKRNRKMLRASGDGATQYDLWPLRLLRQSLICLAGGPGGT